MRTELSLAHYSIGEYSLIPKQPCTHSKPFSLPESIQARFEYPCRSILFPKSADLLLDPNLNKGNLYIFPVLVLCRDLEDHVLLMLGNWFSTDGLDKLVQSILRVLAHV